MKLVSHIIKEKGSSVFSVPPRMLLIDALKIMSEKEIGALLVMEGEEEIRGIFTERDYARKVILMGKSSREIKVSEIMSDKVYYVKPSNTVEECMALMTEKRVRHLPVIDGKNLSGMISIGDVVKALIDDRNFTIDQLVNYIKGT